MSALLPKCWMPVVARAINCPINCWDIVCSLHDHETGIQCPLLSLPYKRWSNKFRPKYNE
jgi:hypothetical protein